MKVMALVAAIVAASAIAEGAKSNSAVGAGNAPDGDAQRQEKRVNRSRKHTGGFILRPAVGKSLRFANAQSLVSEDVLRMAADEISRALGINMTVSRLEDENANPLSLIDRRTAAVIVVRASKGADASRMVVAPEDGWGMVDVGALAKDGPAPGRLAERVRKELWRTTAIMLGASDSTFRPCLLEPVHSLSDLDGLTAKLVSPEPYGNIQHNAKVLGCGLTTYVTYRTACREGWAPAPTNDVQKAIWQEVHAIPDKPITIEFDPKKDK